MAGDWIKMRTDLWDDPRVVRLEANLSTSRANVLGGLYRLWCLADQYTEDGHLQGYDAKILDNTVQISGFTDSLVKVGWLEIKEEALIVPRFDEHNGASARRRAKERNRKQQNREVSASDADKKRPRGRGREDADRRVEVSSDLDGAIFLSEERRARVRDLFNRICESVPCRNEQDFALFGKVALLREASDISEDDFEQCLESVRVNKPATPGSWFHKCLANKMKAQNESFAKMLASCTCPDWLPQPFQGGKPAAQHKRQSAARERDD